MPGTNRSFSWRDTDTGNIIRVFTPCDFAILDSVGTTVLTLEIRQQDSIIAVRRHTLDADLEEHSIPMPNGALRMAVNVDCALVAVSTSEGGGKISAWNVAKGKEVFRNSQAAEHIELSPDGTLLLTQHRQEWSLWELANGNMISKHIFPSMRTNDPMRYTQAFDQRNETIYLASTFWPRR